jgi:glycine oxidase
MRTRIIVVGGGITGAFATYFLARGGAQVTLVERGEIGGEASGTNAGGLNPLHGPGIPGPMQAFALESLRLHLDNWEELRRLSGRDFGAQLVPRLHVATDDAETAALRDAEALHNSTPGFSARWLSGEELRRAEPSVRPDAAGGLWTEGNARVDARAYTQAVVTAAVRLGGRRVRATVTGLQHAGGRVSAVALDGSRLDCDAVVITPGAWCAEPARWLSVALPVQPLKGELLLAVTATAAPRAEITWRGLGVYTAGDWRVWLGGTEDHEGFDRAPSASARTRILEGIGALMPGLRIARIADHVAGLRPVTPDGLPIVGIPPGWENVAVAVGAGRKGMLLGAGLGLAAAELASAGSTRLSIGACSPGRPGVLT